MHSCLGHLIFLGPIFLICALAVPLTGWKITVLQGSAFHCWAAHSKVRRFFCNLCPGLTPFIIYSLSLLVSSGKTQISLLPHHMLENSCHVPFKSSLLVVQLKFPQLFLVADNNKTYYSYWQIGAFNKCKLNK